MSDYPTALLHGWKNWSWKGGEEGGEEGARNEGENGGHGEREKWRWKGGRRT